MKHIAVWIEPMTLSIGEITVRSVFLIFLGVLLVAFISTYTARPSRKAAVPLWIGVPVILGKICLAMGSFGIGMALSKEMSGGVQSVVIFAIGFIGALWCSNIIVQLAQNLGYKAVCAPTQPVRWYNSNAKPSHGGRKRLGKRWGR